MRPVKHAGQEMSGKRGWSVAMKRPAVTLTRQLVVVQVELHECSQLPKLGWDATCEAIRPTSEWQTPVTNCNEANCCHTRPSAGCCASRGM